MRAIPFFLAIMLLVLPASLSAQRPPVFAGARIRVSAPGEGHRRLIGIVSGYDSETIAIKPDHERESITLPLTSVTELHRTYGRRSHVREGALVGFLVGGAGGAAIGAATYEECESDGFMSFNCLFAPASEAQAALFGSLIGGLIGFGFGAAGTLLEMEPDHRGL